MISGRPVWNGSHQPPRSKLSRDEMNVIISQQAAENERLSRLSEIKGKAVISFSSGFSGRQSGKNP